MSALSSETTGAAGQGMGVEGGTRPRMLFLCQTLPFPPDAGVHLRTYNVLRLLSREFDVTALFFYRAAERATVADVDLALTELRRHCDAHVFEIPQEHSRLRLLMDHGRSLLSRRSYTDFAYRSRRFRDTLQTVLRQTTFDIVHVDSLDLVAYLSDVSHLPVVCVHHNVESDLLRRRAAAEHNPLVRRYLTLQAGWIEADERRWCPEVNLNVTVSEADRDVLMGRSPGARFAVVPNGVDTTALQPAAETGTTVLFIGGATWYPNRDALQFFAGDILPLLELPARTVRWVGRASADIQRSYAGSGIDLTGYVPDIRPYMDNAACFIVPLRVGGGTRLKILDAWAAGKAIVSTTIGCEGLDARDGENILIADSAQDFAAAVIRVLEDVELRNRLGAAGRRTAVETYDWEVLVDPMVEAYRSIAGRREASALSRR
jgi:glycosyltransferase involved in cell wall biosynthesis